MLKLLAFILPLSIMAARIHHESFYQKAFCNKIGGQMEVRLPDGTRVDCLSSRYAIEVDFANKVFEGVGQSLYYALKTGRRPGVVVITERRSHDRKNVKRLMDLAKKYDITVWQIGPNINFRRLR